MKQELKQISADFCRYHKTFYNGLCFKGKLKEAKILVAKEPLANFQHAASRVAFLAVQLPTYQFMNDFAQLKSITEKLLEMADEYGYTFWKAWGLTYHGWAIAKLGQVEVGFAEIQQSLAINKMARGTHTGHTGLSSLTMFAEGLWLMGKSNDALDTLEEAFAYSKRRSEFFYLPKVNYLKGEWLQKLGAENAEVEQCFRQAIKVARAQEAPLLELRSALSLAKYWQINNKKEETHSLLTKLLERITPIIDFDIIPEYAEAKEILTAVV